MRWKDGDDVTDITLTLARINDNPPRMERLESFGHLLDARDCDLWLRSQVALIGWTYSLNPVSLYLYDFRRVISGRVIEKPHGCGTQIRFTCNNHIKCYITKSEMLIGSYNLSAPTIEDCAVRITSKAEIKHMRTQFERHWKSLK